MKTQRSKIIVRLLILGVLIALGVKIYNGFVSNANALDEDLPSSNKYSLEDSVLIPDKNQNNVQVIEKYNNKVRNTISLFLYDKKYHLLTYKINSLSSVSLEKRFHLETKSVHRSTGISYSSIGKDISYIYHYKAGESQSSSDLYMTLSGDSIKPLIKNDSIISYKFLLNNLSIRYGVSDPLDIFIENEGNFITKKPTQMNILFLRRNTDVFLLILTPKDAKQILPDDLLYNIVTNK